MCLPAYTKRIFVICFTHGSVSYSFIHFLNSLKNFYTFCNAFYDKV